MRTCLPILALAFAFTLSAAWPAAAQAPAPATIPCIDLSGKWAGGWHDTGTGHHGPLMAKVHKIDDCHYHATFTGTFRKVIPFVYSVHLTVTGYEGDRVLLSGTHKSGLTGRCYEYNAWATNCEFQMTFSSDRYNGQFELDAQAMTALIVGGGIGGLTAAIALRRAGVAVRVFEQAPALRESGAGLSLWSDAMHCLRGLGLNAAVRAIGAEITIGENRSASGRTLAVFPLGDLGRQLGAPIVGVHRADLLNVLAAHVDPADVRTNSRLSQFEQDEQGVTAHFADGHVEHGDLLIGADGIHSRVRELVLGDPQRYCGYVGWRGAASFRHPEMTPGLAVWSFGRGGQFGLIPIGGDRFFWFGTATMLQAEIPRLGPHRDELVKRFRDWHAPIPQFVEQVDLEGVARTPIFDRPPLGNWGTGRVTLLGDAAHATTPTLGHGACLAIESAISLAKHLRAGDIPTALRRYEAERQPRTARVIRDSWRIGNVLQWRNPLLCWLRDRAVGLMPTRLHLWSLRRIMEPGMIC